VELLRIFIAISAKNPLQKLHRKTEELASGHGALANAACGIDQRRTRS
jgi:hypothetical protein